MIKHSTGHEPPTLYEYAWTQQLIQQQLQHQRLDDINDNDNKNTTPTLQYNSIIFIIYEQHHIIIVLIQQMHSYSNSSLGSFI